MSFLKEKTSFEGGGIVLFQDVASAIKGEKILKSTGYEVKLVAPPPELRMGCDLALEINLVEQAGIERNLKEKDIPYVRIAPLKKGAQELLGITKLTDFGQWLMVKAGNMKLTFDKDSGILVNISGGGCPDVPYLNTQLVGKHMNHVPRPRELGYTLCAIMLDVALLECRRLWGEGDKKT